MMVFGILAGALLLASCGDRAEDAAPADGTVAPPASTAALPPVASEPPLKASDLRRVCQAALAAVHGQTVADVRIDGLEGEVVNVSWRAPVDGGRRTAQCRVEGDLVTWRPTGLPEAAANRWMNQATDPAIRFELDGDTVVVTQTLPDGTSSRTEAAVPAEKKAR